MPSTDPPPAFHALFERYERPLIRYAQSILSDLDSARDVVQEVFIKLARQLRSGEEGLAANAHDGGLDGANGARSSSTSRSSSFDLAHAEPWLFTVTRNRALDHQRKHRRIIPMPLPDDRPCAAPTPAATLESLDAERTLLRLLDALSANQREVIRLKFQNDLSYREIAEVTQLTVTNVGFLLHTGLKKLRTLLAEQPQDDFRLPLRNHAL